MRGKPTVISTSVVDVCRIGVLYNSGLIVFGGPSAIFIRSTITLEKDPSPLALLHVIQANLTA